MPKRIAMVLVEPENPDNIGAVARAMTNMALTDLRLVRPPKNWKTKARKMAMGGREVLDGAKVYDSLPSAVRDCHAIIGTTRRRGLRRGFFVPFDRAIEKASASGPYRLTAFVFGKESKGLANEDLLFCHWGMTLPASPEYPSLNLAQAVMVVAFSLFKAGALRTSEGNEPQLLPEHEIEVVLGRMEKALAQLGYPANEKRHLRARIVSTLRGLMIRNGLLRKEAEMFKGLSHRIMQRFETAATEEEQKEDAWKAKS